MIHANFSYTQVTAKLRMPLLEVQLASVDEVIKTDALVDTGAFVNVIPYTMGLRLGLVWDECEVGPKIGGSIKGETRKVELLVTIKGFPEFESSFCWLVHDDTRFLLGHEDFFQKFTVCFDSSNGNFSLLQGQPS